MSATRTLAPRPTATPPTAARAQPSAAARSAASSHRPLLDVDDLDARPEWHPGREALLAFIAELNLPSVEVDPHGAAPAEWLHARMLISVELAYGIPVIVFQDDDRRSTLLLAEATIERLRVQGRTFSS
jgi:hypothetical protein